MSRKRHGNKQKQQGYSSSKKTRNRVIAIGALAAIITGLGYFAWNSMIPANGTTPFFGMPNNHFIKATHEKSGGYVYVSQSSGKVKNMRIGGSGTISPVNPTYEFKKGELESFHVIGGDYETHSKHNFNIDEFNVHTRDLGNFETQTVTFLTEKAGTFEYYCTIHPEMRGKVVVTE